MLGLGRTLGETMAVTFVIGNASRITASVLSPGNTSASIMALELGECAAGSLKLFSLTGAQLPALRQPLRGAGPVALAAALAAEGPNGLPATTASSVPGHAKDQRASAALGRRRARTDALIH